MPAIRAEERRGTNNKCRLSRIDDHERIGFTSAGVTDNDRNDVREVVGVFQESEVARHGTVMQPQRSISLVATCGGKTETDARLSAVQRRQQFVCRCVFQSSRM
ncbi:conserved hypothetical protein [Ricinus communis]|uniref:Uncharacterized protein n=1 Tax=Ricinus communis TaxID=3988 RepID=B9TCR1_RICCO|nr:conserved hypothetical protein [Ricinus communis]